MVAAAIDRWWDPEKQQGLQDMCAAAPSCTSNLCNAALLLIFVKGFRCSDRAYTVSEPQRQELQALCFVKVPCTLLKKSYITLCIEKTLYVHCTGIQVHLL